MKTVILYKPESEQDTLMQGYMREFLHRTGRSLELVNVESREGAAMAEIYDVLQFPALVATRDDGELVELWPDFEKWPTISELSFYNP